MHLTAADATQPRNRRYDDRHDGKMPRESMFCMPVGTPAGTLDSITCIRWVKPPNLPYSNGGRCMGENSCVLQTCISLLPYNKLLVSVPPSHDDYRYDGEFADIFFETCTTSARFYRHTRRHTRCSTAIVYRNRLPLMYDHRCRLLCALLFTAVVLRTFNLTASSIAFSQNGFMDIFTFFSSTPVRSHATNASSDTGVFPPPFRL